MSWPNDIQPYLRAPSHRAVPNVKGNRGSAALLVVLLVFAGACTVATSPHGASPDLPASVSAPNASSGSVPETVATGDAASRPEVATTTSATVQVTAAIVPDITPKWGSAALDLHAQTAFGFGVGYVTADALLTAMTTHLGPVTNDTGWNVMPRLDAGDPAVDCLAAIPARVLRWGDLSFVFFQSPFGVDGEFLWSWSVGDPPSSPGPRREPQLSGQPTATRLRTPQGISVGSPTSVLDGAYGETIRTDPGPQHPQNTDSVVEVDQTTGSALQLRTRRGIIEGIGASFAFAGMSGLENCSTTTVTHRVPTSNVILVGDSLVEQAAPYLQPFFGPKILVRRVFGGTAPCDWLGKDLEIRATSVVVISFSGNSLTSCMTDGAGAQLRGQAVVAEYRLDVTALIAEALYVGAHVLLVGQPVHAGSLASNNVVTGINAMYRDLASARDVSFVDAGAAVENPDGSFASTLPCLASEPRCVLSGRNVVRSDDGVHFCPGSGPVGLCPGYASGAFRFAKAIEQAARDL